MCYEYYDVEAWARIAEQKRAQETLNHDATRGEQAPTKPAEPKERVEEPQPVPA